jgi:hypothetical protein
MPAGTEDLPGKSASCNVWGEKWCSCLSPFTCTVYVLLVAFNRGLQLLGLSGLGMATGFERLHYLLASAFDADGNLTLAFLKVR